jgi:hypothetical protein
MTVESGVWIGKQDSRRCKILVHFITDSLELRIQVCDKLIKLSTQRLVKIGPVSAVMEAVMAGLPEVESGVYNMCQ